VASTATVVAQELDRHLVVGVKAELDGELVAPVALDRGARELSVAGKTPI
jgi:hypothetical protein